MYFEEKMTESGVPSDEQSCQLAKFQLKDQKLSCCLQVANIYCITISSDATVSKRYS